MSMIYNSGAHRPPTIVLALFFRGRLFSRACVSVDCHTRVANYELGRTIREFSGDQDSYRCCSMAFGK